ncbi:MAG: ABC transporter permease subunit [Gammaproteobacteria bacterium]
MIHARSLLPTGDARLKRRRWRRFKDSASRYVIGAAGIGVVIALATIFVYLFSEVMPLLRGASVEVEYQYPVPGTPGSETVHLASDRHVEAPSRFTRGGEVFFYQPTDGSVRARFQLPIPDGVSVTSFATAELRTGIVAYGLSDGTALVARHAYDLTYPDDVRHVQPYIDYPLGEAPVVLDESGAALSAVSVQQGLTGISLAAVTLDNRLMLARYTTAVSFMTGEVEVTRAAYTMPRPPGVVDYLLIDATAHNLFAAGRDGRVSFYDISTPSSAEIRETRRVLRDPGVELTALKFLLGTVSLIAGGSDGTVAQWMPVRDDDNLYHLTHIRNFERHSGAVTAIQVEHSRKGFVTADANGEIAIHFSTSHQTVFHERLADGPVNAIAIAPQVDALMFIDGAGRLNLAELWNEHPEVSFSALWQKVWYEGRSGPEYVWQASSATDEFERKFSMVPLTIGTIKAAFYAMLFAIPLAVFGAIYSAYFMTPRMRSLVKPTIEVMEALPTVILGFLAGLWLAPFMESNLPSVFSILILLPISVLAFGWLWTHLPSRVRYVVPDGWEAALLMVPILLVGWVSVAMSPLVELWLFNGDMRQWFTDVGINYEQRNALVVGIAMGFAVIPTIFSIAEDAVFTVPKHLTQGSLALGATRWQTVTRVVLLTASPGIFSAIMIGLGRAVGETMIVLMATGNSPVVNFNLFEGMRTLSANIAVELPETSVGGSHFRILFLAALLLFAATFILNTIAEVVRQRLRARYSQL